MTAEGAVTLAPAILDAAALAWVTGGESSFGRCGPGSRWQWLGNVYTPQCAAHDAAVRGAIANGTNPILAHLQALPKLPAAVTSYVRAQLGG
jgi:hypothetical protein